MAQETKLFLSILQLVERMGFSVLSGQQNLVLLSLPIIQQLSIVLVLTMLLLLPKFLNPMRLLLSPYLGVVCS
ncbi:unknown protein [Microcystis aeruginosa NIES-843]|uniref:Uncharacterized protein n=1 Tax=Microcystis aeruginosa (strain NIES-843 / IAM M-2473) TaxID=449447 RepID=B0JPA9_MICAN|nr:unknown protein [Microcystis aeruginosa NIES-843]